MMSEEKTSAEPLPKWIMRRYAQLWRIFKEVQFSFEEAESKLKEDKSVLLVLFSNLRKSGWLEVEFNKEDARKRVYKLRAPELVVEDIKNEN